MVVAVQLTFPYLYHVNLFLLSVIVSTLVLTPRYFNCLDAGSQEVRPSEVNINICSNHDDCEARPGQIKLTKGFSAKEPVKGHMASSFFHNFRRILSIENMESKE